MSSPEPTPSGTHVQGAPTELGVPVSSSRPAPTALSASAGDVSRFRSLARFMYPFGVGAHGAMVLTFYALGQLELCLFNVLSVAMWGSGLVLDRKGWVRTAYLLAMSEVVLYGSIGTVYLGAQSGLVSVFIWPVATLYFVPFLTTRARIMVLALVATTVVGVVALSARTGALSPLPPGAGAVFLALNLLIMIFGIALIMNVFSNAIRAVEGRLEAANENLAAFSRSVSEYLDPLLVQGLRDGEDLSPRSCFLTVFFVDLAGSTRISRQMSEQAFGDMLQEFVGNMQQVIKAHNGYLEDISGDGILGYLGNFESRGPERDAFAAVTAAVEMQSRLASLVPRFIERYRLPEPLTMRIGISSGEAQVGKTSGARAVYTANGDIVNLGAKLEQKLKEIPEAGGILLSEATARLVRDDFALVARRVSIEGQDMTVYSLADPAPDAVRN